MDELDPGMRDKIYRSLVTLPRIIIAVQFAVIIILVVLLV